MYSHSTPTPPNSGNSSRAILDYFPVPRRSLVANQFLRPVRAGVDDPARVVAAVLTDLDERLGQCLKWRDEERADEVRESLRILTQHDDEALAYAAWCIDYERLPREERERQKSARSREHILAHMDKQDYTEKQEKYLRGRGYTGPIESRAHASALIDIYMRGGTVNPGGAA